MGCLRVGLRSSSPALSWALFSGRGPGGCTVGVPPPVEETGTQSHLQSHQISDSGPLAPQFHRLGARSPEEGEDVCCYVVHLLPDHPACSLGPSCCDRVAQAPSSGPHPCKRVAGRRGSASLSEVLAPLRGTCWKDGQLCPGPGVAPPTRSCPHRPASPGTTLSAPCPSCRLSCRPWVVALIQASWPLLETLSFQLLVLTRALA